jgi:hypothetical protein
MTEARVLDRSQTGKMVNKNWHDYKLPTALDVPLDMTSLPVELVDNSANTTGAKGLGEPVTIPTAAAIANAVYHATGVRIKDLPITPEKILKALALQIGNEVSFHELGQLLESDKGTIEKYIDLLEKAYIIFRLDGLNRNVRNEIKKGKKIYFHDNGIRNAVIGNFLPLNSRSDTGQLWENFMVSERLKLLCNRPDKVNTFFWRTTQKQEIDYIEERHGMLYAYEFKWNPRKKSLISKTFLKGYPGSVCKTITPENINEFLMETLTG